MRLGVSRPVIALGKADFARQLMRQHLEFSRTLDTAAT
jgi:DNA-binding FadR family transcriptional regulator